MAGRLDEKVAVITGGGSGIGRAMAVRFAREGARVVVVDIVAGAVSETVSEIEASGGRALGVVADVAVESDIDRMIDTARSEYGRIDILCNNAGIMDRNQPITELSNDLWERVLAVNLRGPFWACRRAIPIMIEQGRGAVLNIASVAGLFGCRAGAAYTASKHALIGLTRNIAFMYAANGIRCNAICPGGVSTNIGWGGEPSEFGTGRIGLGFGIVPRIGKPEEIAEVGLLLVSDEAGFVNGAVMTVDGGWGAY
jgi:NAD(P)-dependent dehydrogenase (short-subunit alcohol dehydrogenase family)